MNAHSDIKARYAIPVEHIDHLIAQLVALRLEPGRDSLAYVDFLKSADRIIGDDLLHGEIENWEVDYHGLVAADCMACGTNCRGACDYRYDVSRDA